MTDTEFETVETSGPEPGTQSRSRQGNCDSNVLFPKAEW